MRNFFSNSHAKHEHFRCGTNLIRIHCCLYSILNFLKVRISCNIPIFFQHHGFFIRYSDGERLIDPDRKNFIFIDNGVGNNFPISLFDTFYRRDDIEYTHLNGQTLDFRLIEASKDVKEIKLIETIPYTIQNCVCACEESNLFHHRENNVERTVEINFPGMNGFDFDLGIERGRYAKLPLRQK